MIMQPRRPDYVPAGSTYTYLSTNRARFRRRRTLSGVPWRPVALVVAGLALVAVAAFCLWRIHVIEARQGAAPPASTWVTPSPYGPPPACAGFPARRCQP